MSNLGNFNNAKNTPWARPPGGNATNNMVNQNSSLQQQILNHGAFGNMGNTNMVQFQPPQHQQALQNAMGMQQQNLSLGLQQMANPSVLASNQIFQQVGAGVNYPNPRVLNPNAFQTHAVSTVSVQSTNNPPKQRVFTGSITKVHENFGFVDEDVFFQTSAFVKGSNPMVGDRVLVEASFNPNMPFKWNATRIQVLPTSGGHSSSNRNSSQKQYGMAQVNDGGYSKSPRSKSVVGGRGRERSRDRDRDDDEIERKRRREDRIREREKEEKKSPLRRRSRSPRIRRRSRIVPRYMVQIPKINLELRMADLLEIRRRYSSLYVPSDFFCSSFRWVEAFPPNKPFGLSKPTLFHIMNKDVDPVLESNALLEPPDADYVFTVKVMLISVPGMEEIYQKSCALAEDKDKRDRDSEERDYVHPTRLIKFLVGLRGKNETMAIGGPWSPSLDGDSPATDPSVLIRTAIRTCKALTGIDLSPCTQWYRFLELYYHRSESTHKGKVIPSRVETVVLFLPDVWSCLPTRLEWDGLHQTYRNQLELKLKPEQEIDEHPATDEKEEEEEPSNENKFEPTHYSQLDPKNLSVSDLRTELKARSISNKGLKSQLVARLTKVLKSEAEKAEDSSKGCQTESESENTDEKKMEFEEKCLDEKEIAQLEKYYTLPEQPHIIVHPSRTAKSGKFDCTSMSLSVLLDYCTEDTKEHSFEVSLFAELFNEMLMRDFGFNIYKALYELPEKIKEKDDKKHKDEDEKGKKDEKKAGDKKKDDKKERKKEDVNSEDDEEDLEEEDNSKDRKKSDKDRKKKERLKMFTKDRELLLSFVYFDQTHCGYIFEKDMEDLLFTLGLNLSRAQIRKLVSKVISRDSLHYRKLTDRPKEENFIVIDDSEKDLDLEELAAGNKKLLPIFNNESVQGTSCPVNNEEGIVMFGGAFVDVSKLMEQLERSDRTRIQTEARMIDLKTENTKISEKYTKSSTSLKSLGTELKELKEKLRNSDESLIRMTACCKLFQTTLSEIRDKIDPVLKSTQYDRKDKNENEKERKHEEGKTRWERNYKDDTKKEEIIDLNLSENTFDSAGLEVKDECD